MGRLGNIYRLGIKELISLWRDPALVILVIYAFTYAIYVPASTTGLELRNASVALVDEDRSQLSARIRDVLLDPYFLAPETLSVGEIDAALDSGRFTFVLDIPPDFAADVLSGRQPDLQINVDATAMSQAGIGAAYLDRDPGSRAPGIRLRRGRRRTAAANPDDGAGEVQSKRIRIVVPGRHAALQQHHDARNCSHRRRSSSRARARDHRASPRDAAESFRDRARQGVVQRPRHRHRGKPLAVAGGFRRARSRHSGIHCAFPSWNGSLPVLRHGDRNLPLHAGSLDATVRPAAGASHHSDDRALRRDDSPREHARHPPRHHDGRSIHPFRELRDDRPLPRCGPRGGVGCPRDHRRDRGSVLQCRAAALPVQRRACTLRDRGFDFTLGSGWPSRGDGRRRLSWPGAGRSPPRSGCRRCAHPGSPPGSRSSCRSSGGQPRRLGHRGRWSAPASS